MRHSLIRLIGRLLAVIPAAGLLLAGGLASARPAAPTGWRTIASVPSPSLLLAVSAPRPGHAWAVGWTRGSTIRPLVEAWNGAAWAKVSLPPGVVTSLGSDPVLDTTAASGPLNAWAFSVSGRWLRFNGSTWTAGRIATPAPVVQSSLAFGPASAWAFGGKQAAGGAFSPFASHFTVATGWRRTPVPGKGIIAAASAVSASDIWAVIGTGVTGFGGSRSALVHWAGGHWQTVTGLPAALSSASLGAVLARGDSSVWVGGGVKNVRGGTTELLGHWNGHAWNVFLLSAPAAAARFRVAGLTVDGSGGLWALGFCVGTTCGPSGVASRLWHEVAGRWSGPIRPALAHRTSLVVGFAPVAHSVWAAGAAGLGGLKPSGLIALWGAIPH